MGNKCCGSRSIRTSSKEKRTLKKNEEHSLNSSSLNEHHAAPSKDVDLPSSHISEPSNSELSTRDNRIPNTQPDEGPEITADDNKTKDYKQTKDDNKTEDYKQTTDDNKTEDYKQTIYDNTTKDYKQTKDDNKIEDYKQTTDDNKTKDYKKTKYDNKTKDYKQTTNDNTTKDYKQTKDDKTKDYKQTTDDNKTKDYKQAKDDNKTKDYKKTTYDNKTKDYKQTKDDNKTKDYKQTKDNNKTKDYKQTTYDKTEDYKQTKDDNITKDYKQTKDDKTKDYKQTTDDNKTKDYKQAKDDNKTKDYKKTTYDNKTKYYKQTIDDNTTKDSEQPKDYKQNTDHNTTKDSVKDDDCIVSLLESPRSLAATCKTEDVYARRARLQKVYEELIQKSQETFDTSILFGDKYQTNVTPKDQSKHLESYSELKNEDKDDNSKYEICDKRKSKDIPLSNVTSITHSEKLEEHTKQYNKDFEDTHTTKFCCPCPGLVSLKLKLQKTTQELRHIPNIDNEITLQDIEFEDDQLESTKLDDLLRPDNTEEKPDTEKYITDNDYLSNDDDTRESVSGEESELEKLSKTDDVKSKPEQIKAWKNLAMKPSVQMNRIKLEQFMKYNRKPQLKIIERLRVEDNDIKRNTLSPINKKYKSGTLENLKKKRQISYKKRNTEKRL
ncbi:uncharacterized protein LOC127837914 isoform X2 [Dreissena polymorpha]|uniref:uncharacterized protein LOC127837914 isoform X2 n=1 Tax=Dreissena polymorpha TaxID=45954 RepID=UPI0022652CA3|nr:uncharacterized protein LOC127837914 isoform X2 [Dreissena polymorpha]